MTKSDDTRVTVYSQFMALRMCMDAFKDIYENMPEDDRYCSVLRVVGERMDEEIDKLAPLIF